MQKIFDLGKNRKTPRAATPLALAATPPAAIQGSEESTKQYLPQQKKIKEGEACPVDVTNTFEYIQKGDICRKYKRCTKPNFKRAISGHCANEKNQHLFDPNAPRVASKNRQNQPKTQNQNQTQNQTQTRNQNQNQIIKDIHKKKSQILVLQSDINTLKKNIKTCEKGIESCKREKEKNTTTKKRKVKAPRENTYFPNYSVPKQSSITYSKDRNHPELKDFPGKWEKYKKDKFLLNHPDGKEIYNNKIQTAFQNYQNNKKVIQQTKDNAKKRETAKRNTNYSVPFQDGITYSKNKENIRQEKNNIYLPKDWEQYKKNKFLQQNNNNPNAENLYENKINDAIDNFDKNKRKTEEIEFKNKNRPMNAINEIPENVLGKQG